MKRKTDKPQTKARFIWFDDVVDFALPDRIPPEEKDLKKTIDQQTALDIAFKCIYGNIDDYESKEIKNAKKNLSNGYMKSPNAHGRHYKGKTKQSSVILNTRSFFEWVLQKGWNDTEGLKPVDGWQLRLKRAVGIYPLSVMPPIILEMQGGGVQYLGPYPMNYEQALRAWADEGFKRLQFEKENERLAQRIVELEEEVKRHKPGRRPKMKAG